ncbi:CynX/NimT family MFS transporter [Propylenella binzhouense]|nr:MFS transporter [Propylenella binzhouense]
MPPTSKAGPEPRRPPSSDPQETNRPARLILFAAALLVAALNLRPALTTLGPVLPEIIRDTGISAAGASVLTTIPVLCLGVFGLAAPRIAGRTGTEAAIVAALALIAAGSLVRLLAAYPALIVGTIACGAALGVMGVLLPALVRRDFPRWTGPMMAAYTMALCAGASIGAGAAVPLAEGMGGWHRALAFWAVPAGATALVWAAILLRSRNRPASARRPAGLLWRSALAWHVTLFMGLQSALSYVVFGWLAPILRARGFDAVDAGLIVSGSILVQVAGALVSPLVATRLKRQGPVAVAVSAATLLGLLGCVYGETSAVVPAAILLGLGQGGSMALALTLIVLRSRDAATAAELSGMAQSVGYTIAAGGPLAVGLIHDWFGGWSAIGPFLAAIAVLAAMSGWAAGRDDHVPALGAPASA